MIFLSSSKRRREGKAFGSLHHVMFHGAVDVRPDVFFLLTLAVFVNEKNLLPEPVIRYVTLGTPSLTNGFVFRLLSSSVTLLASSRRSTSQLSVLRFTLLPSLPYAYAPPKQKNPAPTVFPSPPNLFTPTNYIGRTSELSSLTCGTPLVKRSSVVLEMDTISTASAVLSCSM